MTKSLEQLKGQIGRLEQAQAQYAARGSVTAEEMVAFDDRQKILEKARSTVSEIEKSQQRTKASEAAAADPHPLNFSPPVFPPGKTEADFPNLTSAEAAFAMQMSNDPPDIFGRRRPPDAAT